MAETPRSAAEHVHADHSTASGVLFIAYVVAALLGTGYIVRDVVRAANANVTAARSGRDKHSTAVDTINGLSFRTKLIALLALVSFALLSYTMISFLVVHWMQTPTTAAATPTHVWLWLCTAGLFRRFAGELGRSRMSLVWAQGAFLHAVLVSVFVEVEGAFV